MAFRSQEYGELCALCDKAGPSNCARCARPTCEEHSTPGWCQQCEQEYEKYKADFEKEVQDIARYLGQKSGVPRHVSKYGNRWFFASLLLLISTFGCLIIILDGNDFGELIATALALVVCGGNYQLVRRLVLTWKSKPARIRRRFLKQQPLLSREP